MFLQYLKVVISVNCENSSKSDKLLINERDSECHKAVVSDSEVHKDDEFSEVRLVGEIVSWMRLIMMRFMRSERLMRNEELDEDCEIC